ncbi:MAG: insulinase family protein, partial [Clostridia bacterium]|nr:insulinase family protein [Clostridia bacterium]
CNTKYEHPLACSSKAIKNYQPQDIYDYLKKHYIPQNTIIGFAGDITVERAEELVAKYFLSHLLNENAKPKQRENVSAIKPASSQSHVKKDTEQQHVALAIPVCNQYHPDRHALGILSLLLGGDMSSRLFINVREKLGLVYSIHAELETCDIGGNLKVVFSCTPQNTQKVIDVVHREFATLLKEGITQEELNKYRNQLHISLLFDSEVTSRVNAAAVGTVAIHNRVITVEEKLKIIDALTVADINNVIKKYISTDNLITVVVGK